MRAQESGATRLTRCAGAAAGARSTSRRASARRAATRPPRSANVRARPGRCGRWGASSAWSAGWEAWHWLSVMGRASCRNALCGGPAGEDAACAAALAESPAAVSTRVVAVQRLTTLGCLRPRRPVGPEGHPQEDDRHRAHALPQGDAAPLQERVPGGCAAPGLLQYMRAARCCCRLSDGVRGGCVGERLPGARRPCGAALLEAWRKGGPVLAALLEPPRMARCVMLFVVAQVLRQRRREAAPRRYDRPLRRTTVRCAAGL